MDGKDAKLSDRKAPWRKVVSRHRTGAIGLGGNRYETLECGHKRRMKDGRRQTATPEPAASKRRCVECYKAQEGLA